MQRVLDNQLRFDLALDETVDEARKVSEAARKVSEAARLVFERGMAGGGATLDTGELDQDAEADRLYGMGVGHSYEFLEDYLKLRELGWPWRVATYIAWASSPKGRRWPETVEKLAKDVLGLSGPRAIYQWRSRFPTIDAVVEVMQAAPLFEYRRDVINALVTMASNPDYKSFNDRKLFLEMTGDYTPQSKLKLLRASAESEDQMSDDELRALLGEQVIGQSGNSSIGESGEEGDPLGRPDYGWRGEEGEGDDAELGENDEERPPW